MRIMEYVNDLFIFLFIFLPLFIVIYAHCRAVNISIFNIVAICNTIDDFRRESRKMKGKF